MKSPFKKGEIGGFVLACLGENPSTPPKAVKNSPK
jgi:hypothetical protein